MALANSTVQVNYTLTAAGFVTLGIYDNKGVLIMPLISNQNTTILTNTLPVNLTGLIRGNYYLQLTLLSTGVPAQTTTVKFMIK